MLFRSLGGGLGTRLGCRYIEALGEMNVLAVLLTAVLHAGSVLGIRPAPEYGLR